MNVNARNELRTVGKHIKRAARIFYRTAWLGCLAFWLTTILMPLTFGLEKCGSLICELFAPAIKLYGSVGPNTLLTAIALPPILTTVLFIMRLCTGRWLQPELHLCIATWVIFIIFFANIPSF